MPVFSVRDSVWGPVSSELITAGYKSTGFLLKSISDKTCITIEIFLTSLGRVKLPGLEPSS